MNRSQKKRWERIKRRDGQTKGGEGLRGDREEVVVGEPFLSKPFPRLESTSCGLVGDRNQPYLLNMH